MGSQFPTPGLPDPDSLLSEGPLHYRQIPYCQYQGSPKLTINFIKVDIHVLYNIYINLGTHTDCKTKSRRGGIRVRLCGVKHVCGTHLDRIHHGNSFPWMNVKVDEEMKLEGTKRFPALLTVLWEVGKAIMVVSMMLLHLLLHCQPQLDHVSQSAALF